MKNFATVTAAGICLVSLAIGCAIPTSGVSGERFMSDARQSYRSASLVVSGECVDKHTGANGAQVSNVKVTEVMAGSSAEAGEVIQVQQWLDVGTDYLLYLDYGDDVYYAEDEVSFVSVSPNAFEIDGDNVKYGGSSVPVSAVKRDMAEVNKTIIIPANIYYYDTLSALADASERIFIGRVSTISRSENHSFRSQSGGSTVERQAVTSNVTLTAYGCIKGAVDYGESLTLVYAPTSGASMINAETLEPHPCDEQEALALKEGGTYLFFLADDPDAKQDYCFPVNIAQGWVEINGDALNVAPANGALAGYSDLGTLVSDMKSAVK